ncbi:MAG: hypothetical protein KDK36_01680 [Leptospiraceae bacterium]|nr:hypothetical protein [Leptospiraceae bacterium]
MKKLSLILFTLSVSIGCSQLGLTSDDNNDNTNLTYLAAAYLATNSSSSNSSSSNASQTYSCYGTGSYGSTSNISSSLPSWITKNFYCMTIYSSTESGTEYYVFETDSVPPHKSPYWGSSSTYYEAMPSGNTAQVSNFNSQQYKFKIPANPSSSTVKAAPGIAAGVAVNGVILFFGEASPGNTLSAELNTFDTPQGHPDGGYKRYHYHAEPKYIPNYETAILGVMIDGYPVYGIKEADGTQPSTSAATGSSSQYPALDSNAHGHTHSTNEFSSGIFHYHIINWDTTVNIPTMPTYTYGAFSISNTTF